MTPAAALWWSLGLWVAGILVLIWFCSRADEVDDVGSLALAALSPTEERSSDLRKEI